MDGRGRRKSLNGRLCPNALLADGTRYDDATRGGFVLVTGVPLSPQLRAVLAGGGTEVLEVQPGSPLYQWLADGKATAALVRPDFTVLRADRDIAELCEAAPKSSLPEERLRPDLCLYSPQWHDKQFRGGADVSRRRYGHGDRDRTPVVRASEESKANLKRRSK